MNQNFENAITLVVLSGGLSILLFLYTSIRMQRFIVKRYEIETNLLETIFSKSMRRLHALSMLFFLHLYTRGT
jgi:hypothetical protein